MTKEKKKGVQSEDGRRMRRRAYEKELRSLQVELVQLQEWVVREGQRVIVVFEGRDAAGKGGVIKALTQRVSPRVFRVVALPAPTEREKSQLYVQRYIRHFPAAGEVILFDRSWYNRAGVERVMGFCTDRQSRDFLRAVPRFERSIVDDGVHLLKYWLTVSHDEQRQRFRDRIHDDRKVWKLSPMDVESRTRWFEYSRARDAMLDATDTTWAPWHVVRSDDKRRARLNCISHLLETLPYERIEHARIELPRRDRSQAYDDVAALEDRSFIPERY